MTSTVELVIECRDHRVPLSSRNPLFEVALSGRERVMVYTKRDLAEEGTLHKKVCLSQLICKGKEKKKFGDRVMCFKMFYC